MERQKWEYLGLEITVASGIWEGKAEATYFCEDGKHESWGDDYG